MVQDPINGVLMDQPIPHMEILTMPTIQILALIGEDLLMAIHHTVTLIILAAVLQIGHIHIMVGMEVDIVGVLVTKS